MTTTSSLKIRPCKAKHPNSAEWAWTCTACAEELTGLPKLTKRRGVCASLGNLARSVECDSPRGRISLHVYACSIRGEAVLAERLAGVGAVCDECLHWSPAMSPATSSAVAGDGKPIKDSFSLISPIGTGLNVAGVGRLKPWEYASTAILPHLNTPDHLRVVIDLLRLQSRPPFIIVVDTGSPFAVCDEIEQLRNDDVEIHFVRSNGYSHTSEPVAVALDVGFARANTPLIFLTHTDCFPMRPDALEWLGNQCGPLAPVVGWEMSPRDWITDEWKGMVSHTFTMCHAPTMRRIGATWHMQRARDALGKDAGYRADGWPDTETGFAYCLRAAGVAVKLLGGELNYARQTTEWWDHARSLTGTRLYSVGSDQGERTAAYADEALEAARRRVRAWSGIDRSAVGAVHGLVVAAPVKR